MAVNVKFLAETELFKDICENDLEKISGILKEKKLSEDEVVFKENDEGDELYIVCEGTIKITMKAPDDSKREDSIELIGPRNIFGEFSFVDGVNRSASARAQEESKIFVFSRQHFDMIVKQKPGIAFSILQNITRILTTKIRKTTKMWHDSESSDY